MDYRGHIQRQARRVRVKAPPRPLFHGRAFITEKDWGAPLGALRIVHAHVEIPGKGKFPVCTVLGGHAVTELKDGIATAASTEKVYPVTTSSLTASSRMSFSGSWRRRTTARR
jgi:hypothetical protein